MEIYRDPDTGYEIRRYANGPERNAKLYFTCENFSVDDMPKGYTEESKNPGRVEKVRYIVSGETREVKSVTVYLPQGYDESESSYNVLYILHAASGSTNRLISTR